MNNFDLFYDTKNNCIFLSINNGRKYMFKFTPERFGEFFNIMSVIEDYYLRVNKYLEAIKSGKNYGCSKTISLPPSMYGKTYINLSFFKEPIIYIQIIDNLNLVEDKFYIDISQIKYLINIYKKLFKKGDNCNE